VNAPEQIEVDGIVYLRAYDVADGKCPCCGFARGVWTAPLVVRAILDWNERYGRPPKAQEWRGASQPHRPTLTTVLDLFGTWNRAIAAAGLTPRKVGGNRRWTRETILEAFAEWSRTHGGTPPTNAEWETAAPGCPSAAAVVRHFGSWNAAIDAAGFYPRGSYGVRLRPKLPKTPEKIGLVSAAPIAEVLRRELADRPLSALARELAVDPSYIQKITRGETERIRTDYADRILTTLDHPHLLEAARTAA
jgi:hypothetical protein